MTVLGIILILAAALIGLPNTTTYNGLWLLSLIMAVVGCAMCAVHTFTTKEKK